MEKRNAKEQKILEFPCRGSSESIRMPVGTVYGAQDGPTLVVVGGMHGSEFCGIQGAIEVFNKVDPAKLRGKLVVNTIYNLPAFLNHTGFLVPLDGKNPGRTFPGCLDGTHGEIMAYHLAENVLNCNPDFILELHGGDIPEALVPFVLALETGDKAVDDKIKEMANVYNIACVIHSDVSKRKTSARGQGSMFAYMAQKGVPAMLTESGQQGILDFDFVKIHETGITNVMKKMGMLDGEIVKTENRIPMEYNGAIRNQTPGMWYPFVKLRQMVKKDEPVGEIRDYFGNVLATIKAPVDAMITVVRTSPSVGMENVLLEMHKVL